MFSMWKRREMISRKIWLIINSVLAIFSNIPKMPMCSFWSTNLTESENRIEKRYSKIKNRFCWKSPIISRSKLLIYLEHRSGMRHCTKLGVRSCSIWSLHFPISKKTWNCCVTYVNVMKSSCLKNKLSWSSPIMIPKCHRISWSMKESATL